MAMSRREGCRSLIALPSRRISPSVIVSSPAMVLSRVDLPQPEGPTSTRKPPFSRSMSIPLRISTEPNRFFRLAISRKAMVLSFDGAGHQATYEIAARKHIDDEGRESRNHRRGHVDIVFDDAGRGVHHVVKRDRHGHGITRARIGG